MKTASDTQSLYDTFPADLVSIIREHEQHLIASCEVSPALSLELPETLLSYRQWAVAALTAATGTMSKSATTLLTLTPDMLNDFLHAEAARHVDALLSNASVRVDGSRRAAEKRMSDHLAAKLRSQRWGQAQ
jgi:hypothetical protein